MSMPAEPWESIPVDSIKIETEAAILFVIEGDEVWLPKSQIVEYDADEVTIPRWLAMEKGLY